MTIKNCLIVKIVIRGKNMFYEIINNNFIKKVFMPLFLKNILLFYNWKNEKKIMVSLFIFQIIKILLKKKKNSMLFYLKN